MSDVRKPFLEEIADPDLPEADPSLAPPVMDAEDLSRAERRAMRNLAAAAGARVSGMTRFAMAVFGALFSLVLSVAAWNFVTGLFAQNAFLGWIAFVLLILAVLILLFLALREAMGFWRLSRLDRTREAAVAAHLSADLPAARRVVAEIEALYAKRPEAAWGLERFRSLAPEVLDADALLVLAEVEVLRGLDTRAEDEIEAAAGRVAAVTAIVPLALADVAAALYCNIAMIRRIAEIYGGRSGALGSWSLLRKVFASLLAAGAISLADDMVGSVAGGGVLSKLSRRFGEGVVNGALTARVGVAAMEMCRPLPFQAVERPSVTGLVSRALAGLVPRGKGREETEL